MKYESTTKAIEEVVLGKTHFRVPGNDELIAFSPDAIVLSAEILRQVNQGPGELTSNS